MNVSYAALNETFRDILVRRSMPTDIAQRCAAMFADSTLEGTYTHGVNRFPVFVSQIDAGDIVVDARPSLLRAFDAFEQWDGNLGPGNLNAAFAMGRAVALARSAGIGCVALKNTNHWMRGGTYGLQAAKDNCVGICWTNALAAMPPWGGKDPRLGTNPLVLCVPGDPPALVDMSMSQFSYGKLEEYRLEGRKLPVSGGYDREGALSDFPADIEETRRILPTGYWKGAALSMILDMMASALSGGYCVAELTTKFPREKGVSQVFIAFALDLIDPEGATAAMVEEVKAFIRTSAPSDPAAEIRIPGERAAREKEANTRDGIQVNEEIWEQILKL
jgi:3-dehydro-L-gulonate 2-dehydrogenase